MQESYYQEISLALVTAFGRDTEGATWTINFLLEKVRMSWIMENSCERTKTSKTDA